MSKDDRIPQLKYEECAIAWKKLTEFLKHAENCPICRSKFLLQSVTAMLESMKEVLVKKDANLSNKT